MFEFIVPKTLRQRYSVFAHFFRLALPDGRVMPCRSTLEIVRSASVEERGQALLDRRPDHLAFMMNPGSSYAWGDRPHTGNCVAAEEVGADAARNLVRAYPDKVQYQIMRIMACCELDHVRVLNLSDQREARSAVFLQGLDRCPPIPPHSILCRARRGELQQRLAPLRHSVIVGWGRDERIIQLATAATQRLAQCHPILLPVGRQSATNAMLFDYPAPPYRPSAWLLEWVRDLAVAMRFRPPTPRLARKETVRLGREIYKRTILPRVEASHCGEYVAIDVRTGDWTIADTTRAAVERLRARRPGTVDILCERVGFKALHSFGAGSLRQAG